MINLEKISNNIFAKPSIIDSLFRSWRGSSWPFLAPLDNAQHAYNSYWWLTAVAVADGNMYTLKQLRPWYHRVDGNLSRNLVQTFSWVENVTTWKKYLSRYDLEEAFKKYNKVYILSSSSEYYDLKERYYKLKEELNELEDVFNFL